MPKNNKVTQSTKPQRQQRQASRRTAIHDESIGPQSKSPSKKRRLKTERAAGSHGDGNEMEAQESAENMEKTTDQVVDSPMEDSSHTTCPPVLCQGFATGIFSVLDAAGEVNLFPLVELNERCQPYAVIKDSDLKKTITEKPPTKKPAASSKPVVPVRPLLNRHDAPASKTSIPEYQSRMKSMASTAGDQRPRDYSTIHHRFNNIPINKEPVKSKKQEQVKKTKVIKTSSGHSSRGFMWYLCCVVLLVLLSSAALLAFKKIPLLQRLGDHGSHSTRAVEAELFVDQLSLLETQFPSQRPELWKRSKIHLEKHLRTAQPTEPVSLIITAGRRAKRTLHCLAQSLASSFSSALNGTILHIDGASKAGQESDTVKLDIDSKLKEAFEGDKPVAVIHRLEELPPGSTLIFYRYCDHETAAYKSVFLLFTVLLPRDELSTEQSMMDVEEMVQDYVKEKLVSSSSQTSFNEMDVDKFGGLWSRISHLILPVVSEKEVEREGC
ncbi:torsin-1A-interacting protein 2-like isoform X2 [Solea solea]|uniref:torsin-1A-interacting protein 2-like isoform X2 n=1 Tax=Solea solea TaxID=90069 RepID=UPI00272CED13|nr:torsin-1A-interacting protein 2-like isoform X2 [Solea solea]